jgi:hypothetical protein
MCGHRKWESFGRRFQEAVDEAPLREFVAETLVRIEAGVEELTSSAYAPEDASWVRGCRWRSWTEWVA